MVEWRFGSSHSKRIWVHFQKFSVLIVVQPVRSHSVTIFQNVRDLRFSLNCWRSFKAPGMWRFFDYQKLPTSRRILPPSSSKSSSPKRITLPAGPSPEDENIIIFRNAVKYFPNGSVQNSTWLPSPTCNQTTTASCHIPSSSLFTTRLITCRYWQLSWVNNKWVPHA